MIYLLKIDIFSTYQELSSGRSVPIYPNAACATPLRFVRRCQSSSRLYPLSLSLTNERTSPGV